MQGFESLTFRKKSKSEDGIEEFASVSTLTFLLIVYAGKKSRVGPFFTRGYLALNNGEMNKLN